MSLWCTSDNNIECLGGSKGSLFSLQGIVEALSYLVTTERAGLGEFEMFEEKVVLGGVGEQFRRTVLVPNSETAADSVSSHEQLRIESLTAIACLLHRISSILRKKRPGSPLSKQRWRQAYFLKHQNVEVKATFSMIPIVESQVDQGPVLGGAKNSRNFDGNGEPEASSVLLEICVFRVARNDSFSRFSGQFPLVCAPKNSCHVQL